MTSLADAYGDDGVGGVQSHRRLRAGVALLAVGTVLGIAALVVAVTSPTDFDARTIAGVLAGLAAPAVLGGAVVILPANVRLRVAGAIGGSLTVLGVAGFWHAYPEHWMGYGRELTPYVTGVYFLGMVTIAFCLFAGIATFKRRNDPGGTVSLELGPVRTEIVEVERGGGFGGFGSIGFLGSTPDGNVDTQTNATTTDGGETAGTAAAGPHMDDATVLKTPSDSPSSGGIGGAPTSDGGRTAEVIRSPEPGVDGEFDEGDLVDRYCGNCSHFRYVRTDDGMQPHCGLHGEYMDDMEACEQWQHNAD